MGDAGMLGIAMEDDSTGVSGAGAKETSERRNFLTSERRGTRKQLEG
jgi:hypothetical protein